jgi:hypothetical protein
MNNVVILTSGEALALMLELSDSFKKKEGIKVVLTPKGRKAVSKNILSQLNSNSIQEAFEELHSSGEIYPKNGEEYYSGESVLNFLKTIGINID